MIGLIFGFLFVVSAGALVSYFTIEKEEREQAKTTKEVIKISLLAEGRFISDYFDKKRRKDRILNILQKFYNAMEENHKQVDWLRDILFHMTYNDEGNCTLVFKRFQTVEEFEKFCEWFDEFAQAVLRNSEFVATRPTEPNLSNIDTRYYSTFRLQRVEEVQDARYIAAKMKENELKEVDSVKSEVR